MKLVLIILALMVMCFACAHTGQDPCIGSALARQTMSCACPGTLNPACPPWPNDDTKAPSTDSGVNQ